MIVVTWLCWSTIWCCGAGLIAADEPVGEPPELTLRSLYHPEDEFDFDGALPQLHWLGAAPSRLLVKRDDQWNELHLDSGREVAAQLDDRLAVRIAALGGLDDQQVAAAVDSALTKLKSVNDSTVVAIGESLALVSPDSPARWLSRDGTKWNDTTIDPSGQLVGYTRDGDLFVLHLASGRTHRLTNDGSDTLLDGILDWTYQEEIFGRGKYKGFWFSPAGDWLAMLRIDISSIEPYRLPATTGQRGFGIEQRYPKAGDPIPHASLWVWDLRQIDSSAIAAPRQLAQSTPQQPRIITGVWWSPRQLRLVYAISDRVQSWRELRTVDEQFFSGQTNNQLRLLREESSTWVEPPTAPVWTDDDSIIWRSELPTGRNRLYKLALTGKVVTPLSPEDFHVGQYAGCDGGTRLIVSGNDSADTIAARHAYRIDTESGLDLKRMTSDQGWHEVTVSPDGKWFVDRYSTPTSPPLLAVQRVADGQRHLIDRSELKLRQPMIPPSLIGIAATDGVTLPALLVRPLAATSARPCPVVIEVYGGPQAPQVSSRWSGTRTLYRELLARRGVATLVIDNRSSAGWGSADSWPIHRRVGELEFDDLMAGVDWLRDQDWVDPGRLAIRGWSFGGFLTLYAMTHSDAFAAGIAGGSVSDWREYDAFYTERYMGIPAENEAGYDRTAPVRHAESLHGQVLLIHGESDDNVHPSGTMRMADALQQAGKDFQLMIYPRAAHGVTDKRQRWHMTQMTDRFLLNQLSVGR